MRAPLLLASMLLLCGCRAIEGLGGLEFDLDGGGGGAGGGDLHPPEDCTNGVDDDGDGAIDCADPACAAQGFACVGALPDGWSGPVAIYEGAPGTTPACSTLYPNIAFLGGTSPQGAPAACAACGCTPASTSCQATPLRTFNGNNCNSSGTDVDTPSGACVAITGSPSSVRVGDVVPPQGTCSVTGGDAQVTPITWATSAVACGGAAFGGGCAGRSVCAPRPDAPFGTHVCVYQSGEHACPSSYPQKRPFVQAADDRSCEPCTCADQLASCSVTTTFYSDASCQTPSTDMPAPGSCAKTSAPAVRVTVTSMGTATCSTTGGTPKGAVQTTTTTFCCDG